MVCLSLNVTEKKVNYICINLQKNRVENRMQNNEKNSHRYKSTYRITNLAKMAQKLLHHRLAKHFLLNQLYTADMNHVDKNITAWCNFRK